MLAGRAVLCAHPDSPICSRLVAALAPAEVIIASNGYEALRTINSRALDAYVLDYWLPDWSGVALCREIRKTDPHVPIVFVSRARSADAVGRALRAGADVFLSSAFEGDMLRNRVATLILAREANIAQARAEEARAIQDELERAAAFAMQKAERAIERSARAIERSARMKAVTAFLVAGGTRAAFERLWPQVFGAVAKRE